MKKIVVLFAAVAALALTNGCASKCEAAGARIAAAVDVCGAAAVGEGEGEGEGEATCTDADGALAECTAACYEAADCAGVPGTTDFDATSPAFTDWSDCVAACSA